MQPIPMVTAEVLHTDRRLAIPLAEFVRKGKILPRDMGNLTHHIKYVGEAITWSKAQLRLAAGIRDIEAFHAIVIHGVGLELATPVDPVLRHAAGPVDPYKARPILDRYYDAVVLDIWGRKIPAFDAIPNAVKSTFTRSREQPWHQMGLR